MTHTVWLILYDSWLESVPSTTILNSRFHYSYSVFSIIVIFNWESLTTTHLHSNLIPQWFNGWPTKNHKCHRARLTAWFTASHNSFTSIKFKGSLSTLWFQPSNCMSHTVWIIVTETPIKEKIRAIPPVRSQNERKNPYLDQIFGFEKT